MAYKSFAEVKQTLERYMPRAGSVRQAYTLERMTTLMDLLGNPQDTYKTIHVGGTSGKTSTAYYVAALLRQTGMHVGLTVSPHVDEINERVQLDMIPLSEAEYCPLFSEFMEIVQTARLQPTYFELLVAFAYWVFAKRKVDYVVVEVGLGGLLDATNVVHRADKVCVITDIGLDHMEVLGRSVAEIAAQKAGIIRPNNVVYMYEQGEEIMNVMREVCEQNQATLHEVWEMPARELPNNLPLFQRRNWYLAWSVYQFLVDRDKLPQGSEEKLAATTAVYIPARMEIIPLKAGKTLVLDGAHNAQKIAVLIKSLKARFPKATIAVLLSFGQNKDFQLRSSMQEITAVADHLIITSFGSAPNGYKTSINTLKIAEQCHVLGYDAWETIADTSKAYKALTKRSESVLLVTGSFYLLHDLRPLIEKSPKP